ncbi:hypothetical protein N7513_003339 [Penicillium frequentans]|nr:hypothetical protein N7513_003339 [Penicillium glabrum]
MSLLDSHNAGPLSITADEDPDLLYLPNASSSFDENLLTAFQSSQQTATSIPDSDFPLPVLAPFSLQRVGPDRRKLFILFNTMNNHTKQEFIKWWQTTMHGSEPDTQHNIRWEAKHISDAWKNFDQVAHHITGEPMTINSSPQTPFSTDKWEREQIEFITAFNLPFRSLARRQLVSLIKMAQMAPSEPPLLHPRTAQRRVQKLVQEELHSILSTLPLNAKLSIALDCWTSPSKHAFMAITGYFIDRNWNYREILLGFEPLDGPHSGLNLSNVLIELFKKHDITARVLAVTSDNASNNTTLVKAVQESIDSLQLPGNPVIVRIPCLAHVIQLSLRELLGSVKADPQNDEVDKTISDVQAQARALRATQSQKAIVSTLVKPDKLAPGWTHGSPQLGVTPASVQGFPGQPAGCTHSTPVGSLSLSRAAPGSLLAGHWPQYLLAYLAETRYHSTTSSSGQPRLEPRLKPSKRPSHATVFCPLVRNEASKGYVADDATWHGDVWNYAFCALFLPLGRPIKSTRLQARQKVSIENSRTSFGHV